MRRERESEEGTQRKVEIHIKKDRDGSDKWGLIR